MPANDAVGKEYLTESWDGLRVGRAATIVKEVSYEVSDLTVDLQIIALQAAGPDTIFLAALPGAAGQAIRKIYDLGWSPTRYVMSGAVSIDAVLRPAGLEKSKGVMSAGSFQGRDGPALEGRRGRRRLRGIHRQIHESDPNDYASGPPPSSAILWRVARRHAPGAVETICRETTSCGKRRTSRTSNCRQAVAGHQGQHLTRQLFSHPANAASTV